jgi:hypothetical protein
MFGSNSFFTDPESSPRGPSAVPELSVSAHITLGLVMSISKRTVAIDDGAAAPPTRSDEATKPSTNKAESGQPLLCITLHRTRIGFFGHSRNSTVVKPAYETYRRWWEPPVVDSRRRRVAGVPSYSVCTTCLVLGKIYRHRLFFRAWRGTFPLPAVSSSTSRVGTINSDRMLVPVNLGVICQQQSAFGRRFFFFFLFFGRRCKLARATFDLARWSEHLRSRHVKSEQNCVKILARLLGRAIEFQISLVARQR